MKHINTNMIPRVMSGIEVGERLVGPAGQEVFEACVADADRLHVQLSEQRTGRFLAASSLAFAQGIIAAYMAADMCDCGGTYYSTGNTCRETNVAEVRCTGCAFHDF